MMNTDSRTWTDAHSVLQENVRLFSVAMVSSVSQRLSLKLWWKFTSFIQRDDTYETPILLQGEGKIFKTELVVWFEICILIEKNK